MIRVLIADDHGIVRSGLRMLIERQSDVRVVAEAGDGIEAVEQALAERPDVAVLDVSMPRMTGLQAAREIRAQDDDIGLLMLSMHDDDRYFLEALDAGAVGLRAQEGRRRRPGRRPAHRGRRPPLPRLAHPARAACASGRRAPPSPTTR